MNVNGGRPYNRTRPLTEKHAFDLSEMLGNRVKMPSSVEETYYTSARVRSRIDAWAVEMQLWKQRELLECLLN